MPAPADWVDLERPPLRVAALRSALLAPAGPLARLELVPRTGSTNSDLVAAAADEAAWPEISLLVADHQDGGRGRAGRTWHTPARAALTSSLLLRPAAPPSAWSWLPLLVGLGVVRALRDVAGVQAGLKWPNDVLVAEPARRSEDAARHTPGQRRAPERHATGVHGARKVAGVLAEATGAAVVVGVGLNVSQTREELSVPTATSLRLVGAATTDRDTLLRALVRSVAEQYLRWRDADGDAVACGVADAVRESCLTLGRAVRVDLPGGASVTGTADGLDDAGRLLLLLPSGGTRVVAAGDVVHLRDSAPT